MYKNINDKKYWLKSFLISVLYFSAVFPISTVQRLQNYYKACNEHHRELWKAKEGIAAQKIHIARLAIEQRDCPRKIFQQLAKTVGFCAGAACIARCINLPFEYKKTFEKQNILETSASLIAVGTFLVLLSLVGEREMAQQQARTLVTDPAHILFKKLQQQNRVAS